RPWQDTRTILRQFGPTSPRARRAYRAFVADGIPQGRRPDLQGGGLLRSLGGWAAVAALRRGREAYAGDERILGSPAFVDQLRREAESAHPARARRLALATLVGRVCAHLGIDPAALQGGGRTPAVTRARAGIAYLWVERLGRPGRPLAPVLGLHPAVVYQAARRGAAQAQEWQRLLGKFHKTT
ncbi:MAG: transposase, partial [candidate division NC10 bacterium]|nr:transposase [candidate division NC10 bacterium]